MNDDQVPQPSTGSNSLSRRRFISAIGIGAAAGAAPTLIRPVAARGAVRSERAPASPAPGASTLNGDGIVVLVTLYGGSDGLNAVVPAGDPAYQTARGALAWRPDQVLDLGSGFGFNPALAGLHGLFRSRKLAVVQGVGYPNPNRSHFRSMDIWQSGVPDAFETSGWLGRWGDLVGPDPLRMVHVGASVPRALVGRKGAAAALPNGQINLPAPLAAGFVEESRLGSELGPWGARIASSGVDLLRVKEKYGPLLTAVSAGSAGSSLEGGATATGDSRSELDDQLDVVAALIAADTPARVFSVALGGFDTHALERQQHSRLLAAVDGALTRFQAKISLAARGPKVVTLVYSEFGRRVAANLSEGTDHGTAAPVLVLGDGVRGGLHGSPPSLTDLDQGDLKFTTDFRSIYAAILGSVLGADPSVVLPKAPAGLAGLF
jgi:uncharacterized protein (DUF1501 family)